MLGTNIGLADTTLSLLLIADLGLFVLLLFKAMAREYVRGYFCLLFCAFLVAQFVVAALVLPLDTQTMAFDGVIGLMIGVASLMTLCLNLGGRKTLLGHH